MHRKNTVSFIAAAALAAVGSIAHAKLIVDSKGFEAVGGYTGSGATLQDQPSFGAQWEPTTNSNPVPATVVSPPSPGSTIANGLNVVDMVRSTSSQDTRWSPVYTTIGPLPNNTTKEDRIVVRWSEYAPGNPSAFPQANSVGPINTTDSIFGVELNDFVDSKLVGFAGIDVATGEVKDSLGGTGDIKHTGVFVSPNAWNSFEVIADYTAQTYTLFMNNSLVDSQAFADANISNFTDASLVSYGDSTAGEAFFDNYSVELIPEPNIAGLSIFAGCGLLLMRRRRTALHR